MKRNFLTLAAAALVCGSATAATAADQTDSLSVHEIGQIEVHATRASKTTPVAYSELSQGDIERNNYGLDIPSVLALTPSMIATNETGIGIGGTSIRLRGTDATRLNVTINGVSMNNPDSHSMYWYDTPDLISAVGDIQVQRGAGTSTNGTGAFGGAVNMTTSSLSTEFGGDAALTYGSYNTNKQAVHISSGLMGGHWLLDARLTHIGSDGYVDRGSTDLKSYMFQGAYYSGSTMVKLVSFGGKARTYLTYNGVSKEDMALYGRRYHDSGQYSTSDGPFVLADGSHVNYYDDQTDNYLQINNQLIVNHKFNDRWSLNATGFYTYGYGYYKQYKDDAWIMGYDNLDLGAVEQADLIRSKIMRNHLGGLNAAAFYSVRNLDLAFGGSYSYYTCPHWGTLNWIEGVDNASLYKDKIWYDNSARKSDANIFVKANWQLFDGFRLFGDLQYRYVHYKAWGTNDNYDWNRLEMQPIDVNNTYHFFNPHAGINYDLSKHHTLYASFAMAHREPTRNDFTDRYLFAQTQEEPKAEVLYDYEVGYRLSYDMVEAGVNLYYMNYKNQLVYTGLVNDGGDNLNINVPKSYRRGVELSLAVRPAKWFTLGGNATFSQNRIKNYQDNIDGVVFDRGETTISYSPSAMASAFLDFHAAGFEAVLRTQYVGKQYLTNGGYKDLTLDSYCVTNLNLAYTLHTKTAKSVRFGVEIYNLFNSLYCSNGYGGSWLEGDTIADRGSWACYFPQAPLHVLANVTVKF
ncbi:MAG: TonB-dependent receptor [Alistipes sp.]|nr:TonB-dependent receptor [Alistipes sp.]